MNVRAALVAGLCLVAGPAIAAAPTVVVVPFEGVDKPVGELGYAAYLMALGAVDGTDLNVIHLKQFNRAWEHHEHELAGLEREDAMRKLAVPLGAKWIVWGEVSPGRTTEVIVRLTPAGDGKSSFKRVSANDQLAALKKAQQATVGLIKEAGVTKKFSKGMTPAATSLQSLLDYAACYRVLGRQPIGIREPTLLETDVVDEAVRHCERAATSDLAFVDARAALGFAYAVAGYEQRSARFLSTVKDAPVFLGFYWLGKFWLLNRYYDRAQAVGALEEMVAKHPGFLLARGYLGDALNVMKRHEDALKVFESYLDAVPNQPFVMGRIGYTLSKLKRTDEAIDWTKKALRLAPTDPELLLELASRFVDAKKYTDAETILRRLVADGGARGEVHLRLGYALMLQGKHGIAEGEFHRALAKSRRVSEWRTRGRARYDLAKLWMRQDVPDNAIRQLRLAVDEGFKAFELFKKDPDFKTLLNDSRFKALASRTAGLGKKDVKYVSPFPVDPSSGDITLDSALGGKKPIKF